MQRKQLAKASFEQITEARKLYQEGEAIAAIADTVKLHPRTVYRLVDGLKPPTVEIRRMSESRFYELSGERRRLWARDRLGRGLSYDPKDLEPTDFEKAWSSTVSGRKGRAIRDIPWADLLQISDEDQAGQPHGLGYYIRAADNARKDAIKAEMALKRTPDQN